MTDIRQDLKLACDTLRRGGVILYPTDTVWGIGCDATCSAAVQRVFEIKRRADGKALITLVASADDISRYVAEVPEVAYDLVELSDRPVTIVYDNGLTPPLAPELLAADGSVGIRVTRETFSSQLCRMLRRPAGIDVGQHKRLAHTRHIPGDTARDNRGRRLRGRDGTRIDRAPPLVECDTIRNRRNRQNST